MRFELIDWYGAGVLRDGDEVVVTLNMEYVIEHGDCSCKYWIFLVVGQSDKSVEIF